MNRLMGLKNINRVHFDSDRTEWCVSVTAKSCGQNRYSLRINELGL